MSLLLLTVLVAPSADISSLLDGIVGGLLLRYSREQEYKADAFGLDLMNKVYGGNAAGVVDFFERLQKKEGTSAKFTAFLSTHPLSSERVAALKEIIAENEMKEGKKIPLRIRKAAPAQD
jgi:predicted Zn-dependent protease